MNETETLKASGSLAWASECAPNYAEEVASLYSWSSNYEGFTPFRKFLDLIGYSLDHYGSPLADWSNPADSFGFMEIGYLAEALSQYANRPDSVGNFITELLEVESEFGL